MTKSKFRSWLYRGKRPNWLARILNRADAIVTATGAYAGFHMVTLEVAGRKSGRAISLPLVLAEVDGKRYLVSMLGEDVQWVLNVRAAGGKAALLSGGREEVQLTEVPVEQRAPILQVYVKNAPGGRAHMPVDVDSTLSEFEAVAAQYPTFLVTSRA